LKNSIIQTLKFLTFLLAGLLLLWLAFRNIHFSSLGEGLREAKYSWVILALIFALFAYVSRARRWVLLINPLGYKPSLCNSFNAMMTGYLANMALPRIGEITKCVALGKKENIPVDQLIGTVVVERTIDLFSLMVIMVIMLFAEGSTLGPFLINNVYTPMEEKLTSLFGFAWIFWIILFLSSALILYLIYYFRNRLRKIRFFKKIFDALHGIFHGIKTVTLIERKWEFVFHTFFIWINYIMMTWVVVFAVKSTSHLNLADAIFLLVIGGLAMSAPVQSGLGAFHFIISRGLFVIYGISLEDGLVYALLSHESQMIFGAIIGIYSFYSIFKKSNPPTSSFDKLRAGLKGG
jgi:uncharacterized protein (TIRG00374 family)